MDFASCKGQDPRTFFTEDGKGARSARLRKIKERCINTCAVIDDCLLLALREGSMDGVFGGTTGRDRREIFAGRQDMPEWGDERHFKAVAKHREEREVEDPTVRGAGGRAVRSAKSRELAAKANELLEDGYSVAQAAEMLGVTEVSIYRYARRQREALAA